MTMLWRGHRVDVEPHDHRMRRCFPVGIMRKVFVLSNHPVLKRVWRIRNTWLKRVRDREGRFANENKANILGMESRTRSGRARQKASQMCLLYTRHTLLSTSATGKHRQVARLRARTKHFRNTSPQRTFLAEQ